MAKHPWLAHMDKTRKAHPGIKDIGKLAKLAKKTYKPHRQKGGEETLIAEQDGGTDEAEKFELLKGGRRSRKHRKSRKAGMRGGAEADGSADITSNAPAADADSSPAADADSSPATDDNKMPDATSSIDAPQMEGGRRRRRRSAKKSHKKSHKKGGKKSHKKRHKKH